ncbi:MAG: DUF2199 domain-containing protein [Balneola sp.]
MEYDQIPLCFGPDFPDYYFSVPPENRAERIELKESICVVDKKHFFHRGRLTIPIVDYKEDLIFNVWTSISEDNFGLRMDLWEDPKRTEQEPYFGWLQTQVPTYGDTLNKKTIAFENEVGFIPTVQMIEESCKLTSDQENGISLDEAKKIVNQILRTEHDKN